MTLGDTVYNLYEKYIQRTPSKEDTVVQPDKYSEELLKGSEDVALTPVKREELAHQCPIFMKGVRKKTMDSIRAWFKIETDNGSKPISVDEEALRAFEKRSNYKKKFSLAVTDSYIYGDGFLLIKFDAEDNGIPLSEEPRGEPRDVVVVSPKKITSVTYLSETNRTKDLFHYVLLDKENREIYIHPDRIQHIKIDDVSDNKLGLSKVDVLVNTLRSKKNVDIAVGRILSWFSHGLLDIKIHDLSDAEQKNVKKVAETHPSAWLHDPEDFEVEVIQPEAINPKDFFDWIVLNVASVLVMPVHVLTGIQVGKVTGAEIGFADYYRDICDIQELVYTPLVENLYKRIIEARGRQWKYNLVWDTVYVDELSEAAIMEKRSIFIKSMVEAGVISKEEAREMLNKGFVEINPTEVPPEPRPPQPKIPFNPPKRGDDEA